ncbi:MAG: DUF4065 domain-containing protein [Candidatus Aminicenantes bacterium]|nr:DUF4065 domain-containing protein [Candidatus Aminicenantes bacterium]
MRKQKGFSQDDLASYLEIPRSSFVNVESGKRNISVAELIKLSALLGFSLDRFLSRDYEMEMKIQQVTETEVAYQETRVSDPELQVDKLKNVILYILERCGGKPNMEERMLYKLLYFCDLNFFETYEDHLTGVRYLKLASGPIPVKTEGVISHMLEHGLLQKIKFEYKGYPQIRFLPMEKPDLTKLNAAEKEVMDQVINRYSDWSVLAMNEYIHRDMPWKATEEGEFIDYELVFYREYPYSVRMYENS